MTTLLDTSTEPVPLRASRPAAAGNGESGQSRAALSMADFLAVFGANPPAPAPAWLNQRRQDAIGHATKLGFPTPRQEEWRFTNIKPVLNLPLHPAGVSSRRVTAQEMAPFTFGLEGFRLVFTDGHFCPELSTLPAVGADIQAGSLRQILADRSPGVEERLGRCVSDEAIVFTALNTAFFQDGAFISVAAGKSIAQPVHLLFISTSNEAGATAHIRNLIVAGERSEVKILETYASLSDAPTLTNTVTELFLDASARVDHCKIQEENRHAFHLAAIQAQQGRASHWTSHSLSIGAHLARNQIQTLFQAEGGECVLNGLYLGRGDQRVDHHTVVDHAQPRCESHEFYHGVLSGRAHGVFNGKIFVREDAQKTNAKQTNRNLLLSADAVIDTKPQLEIFADDVKCTHGATVGQIDDEAIFYLRSRGIGLEQARNLMIRAFASDVAGRIPHQPVRSYLDQLLAARFKD